MAEFKADMLIQKYRDALRVYHAGSPEILSRVDHWEMRYDRGWFYIRGDAVRRQVIEQRIKSLKKGEVSDE
jgi:hypothetical protein